MRITAVRVLPVRIPLKPERRMVSALGRHEVSRYVLVRVETDAGIDGAGEATVMPRWSGETVWGAAAILERTFAPLAVGRDPHDVEGLDALLDQAAWGNWFAKSALEMACWDIVGKEAGRPLDELWGGPVRSRAIRCRFSMGAYPPERARNRTRELVAAGFDTIKVKVGTHLDEDVERVRIVRETAGPQVSLVIDANGGYDAATAIEAYRRMEGERVGLFEQPVPRGDVSGMRAVRQAVGCPVMADESVFDIDQARELLDREACDVLSVYPGKNGGLRKTREIVEEAERRGVACSIGSNLELDVATAAMCRLATGCRNVRIERFPGDILGPEYHETRIARDPWKIEGPTVFSGDGPGLGVEVEWGLVEKLAAAGVE